MHIFQFYCMLSAKTVLLTTRTLIHGAKIQPCKHTHLFVMCCESVDIVHEIVYNDSRIAINVRLLMIFQTEIETWVCHEDVPWATYYDIQFCAVQWILTELWQYKRWPTFYLLTSSMASWVCDTNSQNYASPLAYLYIIIGWIKVPTSGFYMMQSEYTSWYFWAH